MSLAVLLYTHLRFGYDLVICVVLAANPTSVLHNIIYRRMHFSVMILFLLFQFFILFSLHKLFVVVFYKIYNLRVLKMIKFAIIFSYNEVNNGTRKTTDNLQLTTTTIANCLNDVQLNDIFI